MDTSITVLYKKGIYFHLDLFDQHTRGWIPWDSFQKLHRLNVEDKDTYDIVIDQIPLSIWNKVFK